MIDVYFWPTPNSQKVVILLEEMQVPYVIKPVNISVGEQFGQKFLRISPNNRVPAIVDTSPSTGGDPISIFESAAILTYLAEKYRQFWPQDIRNKYEVMQWVAWQPSNQGAKSGERNHFRRIRDGGLHGDQAYAMSRHDNEVDRLFGVLNLALHRKVWLAAGDYTIADVICYPWAALWEMLEVDLSQFPNVQHWLARIANRPAVIRAQTVGKGLARRVNALPPEERAKLAALLGSQRAVPIPEEWRK
jgi:GST-like protein